MSARCERPTFLQFSAERLSLLRKLRASSVAATDRRGHSTGSHRFGQTHPRSRRAGQAVPAGTRYVRVRIKVDWRLRTSNRTVAGLVRVRKSLRILTNPATRGSFVRHSLSPASLSNFANSRARTPNNLRGSFSFPTLTFCPYRLIRTRCFRAFIPSRQFQP